MITRDVAPSAVADLASAPPRTALAAVVDDHVVLVPVRTALEGTDPAAAPRIVSVPPGTPDLTGRDVVVVSDDGPQWFRLRSLTVRGVASAAGHDTYRVTPRRTVAWDYGALRDDPDAQSPQRRSAAPARPLTELPAPAISPALEDAHVTILATRSAKGMAFAVPLWFVVYDGCLHAATSASSWTVRNVTARPEVAALFGGERGEDARRTLVRGTARARLGMPDPQVLARTFGRYYANPRFAAEEVRHMGLWGRRMRYYSQSRPASVIISPQTATVCRAP
ncbi:pyridoxamine 5'-phosphate oxidase family protein [Mycolicibacterium monacense]|uniref:Pyridoxamine 5'-phosphate oxidase N-terminal domain-containing protein n=2 Tax=Mycobacteriaceae TaxID=1762 RepID=A0AAD1N1I5_MYCMB|nr:pyridoxamine 5'-phosphate oxidase family protein [Mycolicibacterium monacense]MDA4103106.1 hypothetical protein [Mycolicibacterium monacense DSM 44395]BBZ63849.1 hypothetical protein MMON_51500 [Mycolicibacterium monacense]